MSLVRAPALVTLTFVASWLCGFYLFKLGAPLGGLFGVAIARLGGVPSWMFGGAQESGRRGIVRQSRIALGCFHPMTRLRFKRPRLIKRSPQRPKKIMAMGGIMATPHTPPPRLMVR